MKIKINLKQDTIEKVIGKSKFDVLDNNIKAIKGIKVMNIFKADNGLEFISYFLAVLAFSIFIGILSYMNGGGLKLILFVPIAVILITFGKLNSEVKKYKSKIVAFNELPATLEILSIGIEFGMPEENIIRYIVEHRKGIVRDLFGEVITMIDLGNSLNDALKVVTKKALVKEFKYMTKVLSDNYNTGSSKKEEFLKLRNDLHEEFINNKIKSMEKIKTSLFPYIFVGILIPILVGVAWPMLSQFTGF